MAGKKIRDQFADSLSSYLSGGDLFQSRQTVLQDHNFVSQERHWGESAEDDRALFGSAYMALSHLYCQKCIQDLDELSQGTGSIVERAFLYALCIASFKWGPSLTLQMGSDPSRRTTVDWDYAGILNGWPNRLKIHPQAKLGDYTVDFLLEYEGIYPDEQNRVPHPDGKGDSPGIGVFNGKLIVECDGHEWHDGSKSRTQASRDRKRDRELMKVGYQVFRYTGSDVWKDAFKCADEALGYLMGGPH